jgi:hypothetical protein
MQVREKSNRGAGLSVRNNYGIRERCKKGDMFSILAVDDLNSAI